MSGQTWWRWVPNGVDVEVTSMKLCRNRVLETMIDVGLRVPGLEHLTGSHLPELGVANATIIANAQARALGWIGEHEDATVKLPVLTAKGRRVQWKVALPIEGSVLTAMVTSTPLMDGNVRSASLSLDLASGALCLDVVVRADHSAELQHHLGRSFGATGIYRLVDCREQSELLTEPRAGGLQ